MTVTRSGIPTTYHKTNFRSRLEARWAAFFDAAGWRWTYEPFDADGYIPDFLIRGETSFLVEVGPCVYETDYHEKAMKARTAFPAVQKAVGPPGEQILLDVPAYNVLIVGADPAFTRPGWLAVAIGFWAESGLGSPEPAFWVECATCNELAILAPWPTRLAPCGHHAGLENRFARSHPVDDLWMPTANTVQWQPPRRRRRQ